MKVQYYQKPVWSAGADADKIVLQNDWMFEIDGVEYWIPAGYECDGASIPAAFWAFPGIGSPTQGFNAIGAWAHDALYLTHAVERKVADEVAYQLWIQAGKPKWSARVMWLAIRSPAGAWAYRNTAKDMEELAKVRKLIRQRTDQRKFQSLWFVNRAMPISICG